MTVGDTIEGVLIESDETGFKLILSGYHAEYHFDIHGIADELWRTVKREIEPWYLEGQRIRVEVERERKRFPGEAYAPTDPKHPDYHDTMSELWDNREK